MNVGMGGQSKILFCMILVLGMLHRDMYYIENEYNGVTMESIVPYSMEYFDTHHKLLLGGLHYYNT